jgi:transforming growth factor-beta-induced protein
MNRFLPFALLPIFASAGFATAQHGDDAKPKPTIVQIAADAGTFHTLVAAVKAAGLAETLSGKGPFTVFAPTDAAFAKLGKDTLANLLKPENKAQLTSILTYHVVGAQVPAATVVARKELTSLQGSALPITVTAGKVQIGTATVTQTDLLGSNGVIHVIDSVLLPPAEPNLVELASKAGRFGTLLKAAVAAGLADTLAKDGPFTVFAPTDEAFAKLGQDTIANLLKPENKAQLVTILKNHVVAGKVLAAQAVTLSEAKTIGGGTLPLQVRGKTLHVGTATVVATDLSASNGVIHVIDSVLVPQG